MAELAYATDLKSVARKGLWVRVPPVAYHMHKENCPQHPNYLSWISERAPFGIIDLGRMEFNCMTNDRREWLTAIALEVAEANDRWWRDLHTNEPIQRNTGEMLMLCVSELAEAMEGHRKDQMDDKLPHRKMFDVEIVDTFIRLFDIAGHMIPEFGEIFEEKMKFNANRHDHTAEGRLAEGGKKY